MLHFTIRGRRCAMAVSSVKEVVALPVLTPVPLTGSLIRGVMPLRGQPIPVIDLGPDLLSARQDHEEGPFEASRTADEFVLVIETSPAEDAAAVRAALTVDRVLSVSKVQPDQRRPTSAGPSFVTGTAVDQDGPALIIDCARTVDHVMASLRREVAAT